MEKLQKLKADLEKQKKVLQNPNITDSIKNTIKSDVIPKIEKEISELEKPEKKPVNPEPFLPEHSFANFYTPTNEDIVKAKSDFEKIKVEQSHMMDAPIFETHNRGKNWLAVIEKDPKAPGGLGRKFKDKGKGDFYYSISGLKPGDAVEFGADYYSGSGRKNSRRWYGIVFGVDKDEIMFIKSKDANEAISNAKKFEKKPPTEKEIKEFEKFEPEIPEHFEYPDFKPEEEEGKIKRKLHPPEGARVWLTTALNP